MILDSAFKFILDLLFPSFCVNCRKEGRFLCVACEEKIIIKRVPTHLPNAPKISAIYAAAEYHDKTISELVIRLKFRGVSGISDVLAGLLISHLELARFARKDGQIIVPVPLHKKRLRKRTYNQAELVAKKVTRHFNLPMRADVLKRIKNTDPQTEISDRQARRENVKNAFACAKPEAVKGKTIILVDDVATTGATLNECARALRQSGARSVIAFVVAH